MCYRSLKKDIIFEETEVIECIIDMTRLSDETVQEDVLKCLSA